MKKKLLTTAILLTGLTFATSYHYTLKISDTSLFNNSQPISNTPTMQDATPLERTGVQSTGVILASDGGVDWYGEVSATNLISGDDLAALIGLTSGNSQFSDAGWLHIALDEKELYIAKVPFRNNLTWNQINSVNAVYGNQVVNIQGIDYKIRLMKCAKSDNINFNQGQDHHITHNSEWNRILYRLTNNTYIDSRNIKTSEKPFINLANYSEEHLHLHSNFGHGTVNWCQESIGSSDTIMRGLYGVSMSFTISKGSRMYSRGWRPVLEKVN